MLNFAANYDPYDAVLDLLLEEGNDMHQLLWTSHAFLESDIELCLKQPECAVISDTLALAPYGDLATQLGSLSGYGWTSEFLNRYVKERNVMSLSEGVRRLTSLPAQRLGLGDRGLVREGFKADIVVFDPDAIRSTWTVQQQSDENSRYDTGQKQPRNRGLGHKTVDNQQIRRGNETAKRTAASRDSGRERHVITLPAHRGNGH